ncbi:hypothetical protein Tco_1318324 [Tanacetum coccineum]
MSQTISWQAGSKDRTTMLGRDYSQWRFAFSMIHLTLNRMVNIEAAENIYSSSHEEDETNTQHDNREHTLLQVKRKAIFFLILDGIGDVIYSTVDALQRQLRRCGQPLRATTG